MMTAATSVVPAGELVRRFEQALEQFSVGPASARATLLALALSCVMSGAADPLGHACLVLADYHARHPLHEEEIAALYAALATCLRTIAESRADLAGCLDSDQARALLERMQPIDPALAHYLFRGACGFAPCPSEPPVTAWLSARQGQFYPVLGHDLAGARKTVLRLGDPGIRSRRDWALAIETSGATARDITIGRYAESRAVYDTPAYASVFDPAERRTVHLGLDLGAPAGTQVHAPLEGTLHSFADNALPGDYGPTIILEHRPDRLEASFYTLYGHLQRRSLEPLEPGQRIAQGQRVGWIGEAHENGGWPPHLHFQIITDMLGQAGNFHGVGEASKLGLWKSLCPDPELILDIGP